MNADDVATTFRHQRQRHGLSQQQLADAVGTSRPQISRMESGRQDAGLRTWARALAEVGAQITVSVPGDCNMEAHRAAEIRSRLLHTLIAAKSRADPAIMHDARAKVDCWVRDGEPCHPYWAVKWQELLAHNDDVVRQALMRDDEPMRALRQSSPFAGALTDDERLAIVDAVGELTQGTSLGAKRPDLRPE